MVTSTPTGGLKVAHADTQNQKKRKIMKNIQNKNIKQDKNKRRICITKETRTKIRTGKKNKKNTKNKKNMTNKKIKKNRS